MRRLAETRADDMIDDIATRYLETMGRALDLGDFAAFRACFAERKTLATSYGERRDMTEKDCRETFGRVRWYFRLQRVVRVERRLLQTLEIRADRFVSVHETRVHGHHGLTQAPFRALSTFTVENGAWRVADSCYAIPDSLGHDRALLGPGRSLSLSR